MVAHLFMFPTTRGLVCSLGMPQSAQPAINPLSLHIVPSDTQKHTHTHAHSRAVSQHHHHGRQVAVCHPVVMQQGSQSAKWREKTHSVSVNNTSGNTSQLTWRPSRTVARELNFNILLRSWALTRKHDIRLLLGHNTAGLFQMCSAWW